MARTRSSGPTDAARRSPEEAHWKSEGQTLVEKANASKLEYRERNRKKCNLRSAEAMRRHRAKVKTLPAKEQQARHQQRLQHDAHYRSSHANERRAASKHRRHADNPCRITRNGQLQHPETYSASDRRVVQQNNTAKKWRQDRAAKGEVDNDEANSEERANNFYSDASDGANEHAEDED
ncbi:hypothetical protein CPB85DRAFT_1433460 [Mucidula mucida]|nr:hypothetical protein CPB85DRAFT_1433460 [Mucidula mucida]